MKRILRYHIPILFAVLFFVCIIGNLNDTVPEMQDISVNTETEYCFKSNFAYNINAYVIYQVSKNCHRYQIISKRTNKFHRNKSSFAIISKIPDIYECNIYQGNSLIIKSWFTNPQNEIIRFGKLII